KYDPKAPANTFPGLLAKYKGDPVSNSIWSSPALLFSPRLGFALDVTGAGKTVIRGGVGVFHYIDRNGDMFNSISNPPLHFQTVTCCGLILSQIDQINPATTLVRPG